MNLSNVSDVVDFFKTEYPYTSYNYFVITDWGITSFSKISGLTLSSDELKPFVEGGRKDVHILHEQSKSFNTMTLEKGVGKMDFLSYLGPLNMLVIVCLARNRAIKTIYFSTEAVLQKVTLSDLNASSSEVLINSATIAYNRLITLPLVGLIPEEVSQALMSPVDSLLGNSKAKTQNAVDKTNVIPQIEQKGSSNEFIEKCKNVNNEVENNAAYEQNKLEEDEKKLAALLEDIVDFTYAVGDVSNDEEQTF